MVHKKTFMVIGAILLLTALFATSGVASATGTEVSCAASPTHGVPGTVFHFSCSGFPALTFLWVYVVEPDGLASGSRWNLAFVGSGTTPSSYGAKTDGAGNAGGTWYSDPHPFGYCEGTCSDAIGDYTWVFQTANASVFAKVTVTLDSQPFTVSGATLSVSGPTHGPGAYFGYPNLIPTTLRNFTFTGAGFAANEVVDVWITVPQYCSSAQNAVEANALRMNPYGSGFDLNGIHGPGGVKADGSGNITFRVGFDALACAGIYTVTARALGSGHGAMVSFELRGNAETINATLTVIPQVVDALFPDLTIVGSGFGSNEGVNCWFTRPDGRVADRPAYGDAESPSAWTVQTDAGGSFSLGATAGNATYTRFISSFRIISSEEPGVWAVSCRGLDSGKVGTTTFMVVAGPLDP